MLQFALQAGPCPECPLTEEQMLQCPCAAIKMIERLLRVAQDVHTGCEGMAVYVFCYNALASRWQLELGSTVPQLQGLQAYTNSDCCIHQASHVLCSSKHSLIDLPQLFKCSSFSPLQACLWCCRVTGSTHRRVTACICL